MDENSSAQGQQGQGRQQGSQGSRNQGGQERGAGQGERNKGSGISNRGLDEIEEQADLPSRGSSAGDSDESRDRSDQSER